MSTQLCIDKKITEKYEMICAHRCTSMLHPIENNVISTVLLATAPIIHLPCIILKSICILFPLKNEYFTFFYNTSARFTTTLLLTTTLKKDAINPIRYLPSSLCQYIFALLNKDGNII